LPCLFQRLRGQFRQRRRNVHRDSLSPTCARNVSDKPTQRLIWWSPPAPARMPRETPEVRRPTAIAPDERESAPDTVSRCGCSSVKAATDLALLRAVAKRVGALPPRIDGGLGSPNQVMRYGRQAELCRAGAGFAVRVPSSACRQHYGGLAEQSTLPRQVSTLARMGSTQSSLEPWLRWTS